ncbi:MAG: hypothetical protein ABL971_09595 [Vicinamibacterales bacterium]
MILLVATTLLAVGKDNASYLGGTPDDFPVGGLRSRILDGLRRNKITNPEGTLDTGSASALVFDAGRDGQLTIAYRDVTGLAYGRTAKGMSKEGFLVIGWDPLDQYSKKAHYLLSIQYRVQSGAERIAVFELGKTLIQPTLQRLEAHTGRVVEFEDFEACRTYKSANECGFGEPGNLRGLTKVYLDAGPGAGRDLIVAELDKAHLNLELLSAPEGAEAVPVGTEIVLRFRGEEIRRPGYLQTLFGGRGEVLALRDGGIRTVVAYSGTRLRGIGAKPATAFAAAFVVAYREGNP